MDYLLEVRGSNNSIASNDSKINSFSKYEPYLYGTASVAVISLLSVVGAVIMPLIKRKVAYDGVMLTFMSLAVGSMTAESLIHLVPDSLGLDDVDVDDENNQEKKTFLGKMVLLLATLYVLYLLESAARVVGNLNKKSSLAPTVLDRDEIEASSRQFVHYGTMETQKPLPAACDLHQHDHRPPVGRICGIKSVVIVIVVSDAMHNFTDGLALGAAFAKSSSSGLGVAIAVACHELPHEIGNFAILLNTGMPFRKALLINFLSASTSFAGLYPGILVGVQETLSQWIFAVVAAGFLYVALVHMLRELHNFRDLPWHLSLLLQNLGILVGFFAIYILALYEDALSRLT